MSREREKNWWFLCTYGEISWYTSIYLIIYKKPKLAFLMP